MAEDKDLVLENIQPANIKQIMETAYIDYSMSVIVARALPDVRDGMKPVQRRVIYAMSKEGIGYSGKTTKCAGVVGEVLKNYHPHGDSSVYDTLVRLAQSWVMRYPLIFPKGNFGSIEGDSAAAYRYTECKLQSLAEDLLGDIKEDTVDFMPNYNGETLEPTVLPAALPNLLMNGSTGIAVGMATNIPPHNCKELVDFACALIDNPSMSFDEVETYLKGPDFPTGGVINGYEGIREYFRTGRGKVCMRGVVDVEEIGDRTAVVIKEIPYNVNRAELVKRIAELVKDKVLTEVSDLRNESSEDDGTRIVIELKKGTSERVVINKLYKHTQLETTFGVILLALDHNRPKQMNIKEMMECFIEHRREVIKRRTIYRLREAEMRAHILEGYKIAYRNMDDIIKIIRRSSNDEEAIKTMMERYGLSEIQSKSILDMKLRQLTQLAIDKIEEEYQALLVKISGLKEILSSEHALLKLVKTELREASKHYEGERKTRIQPAEGEYNPEDFIKNEPCAIVCSHEGFIKRVSIDQFRLQNRRGTGTKGNTHDNDFIEYAFSTTTHDRIMFFTNKGRVYVQKAYEIPEGSRTSMGRALTNVLDLQEGETLATLMPIKEFSEDQNVFFATAQGQVKKTVLAEYKNCNRRGIIAINLREGDQLVAVRLTSGNDQVMLFTEHGKAIRFEESETRQLGRSAAGVIGMRLGEGDKVVALEVVDQTPESSATILIVGKNGKGKRTYFNDKEGEVFRTQHRGGVGIIAITNKTGVAGAVEVTDNDQVMVITTTGQSIRFKVRKIRKTGRTSQGVILMNLGAEHEVGEIAALVKVASVEEDEDAE
ncbi:MAG: DNA gyrase subunit A [Opitutales bacterium]|nr:DNA gyrase subunit A [Opitutales bacterium]